MNIPDLSMGRVALAKWQYPVDLTMGRVALAKWQYPVGLTMGRVALAKWQYPVDLTKYRLIICCLSHKLGDPQNSSSMTGNLNVDPPLTLGLPLDSPTNQPAFSIG